MNVIYVDDAVYEEAIPRRVVRVLREAGNTVFSFDTLTDARKFFELVPPDVVITDGCIPVEPNGWRWAKELHGQGVKVIVVAGGKEPPFGCDELPFLNKMEFFKDNNRLFHLIEEVKRVND